MKEITQPEQMAITSEIANNNLVTKLTPDALRTIFAMCFGRPDSLSKVINRKFKIVPTDLVNLNDKICRSLELRDIVAQATSITIKFSKNRIVSLENWNEFKAFDWQRPETVKYVELRWDFFIQTKLYQLPQRHSLSVKISNDICPLDIFRMMASGSTSENEFERNIALCYVNVDFIHHELADELIHIVTVWADSLPLEDDDNKIWNWCKKQKEIIARFIHCSLPTVFFFCITILLYSRQDSVFVKNNQVLLVFWTLALLNFTITIGKYIATKIYTSLDAYEMYSPFEFSSGDKNHMKELQKKNKKRILMAIGSFVLAFFTNLFCGILTAYFVK